MRSKTLAAGLLAATLTLAGGATAFADTGGGGASPGRGLPELTAENTEAICTHQTKLTTKVARILAHARRHLNRLQIRRDAAAAAGNTAAVAKLDALIAKVAQRIAALTTYQANLATFVSTNC